MWTLILYLLVIANQIECQIITELQAERYVLSDEVKNFSMIELKPPIENGPGEYNYIFVVSRPSFLRINSQILFRSPKDGNSEHLQEDILFVMKTNSTVKSWKVIESEHRNKHQHQYAATISKTTADNEEIRITVYNSNSFQHVGFRLKIKLVDDKDVMLELNQPINTTISKTTSRLFQYIFPNSTNADEMVLLTIRATTHIQQCSLVSVQPINSNQVYDEEENMRFGIGTLYQTMSNLSAIILKKEHFPNGANIVLLSLKNDQECREVKIKPTSRNFSPKYGPRKDVTISIETMDGNPFRSTIVILAGYFAMILVALVTFCFFKRGVVGKIDTYTKNLEDLEEQRNENKKKKKNNSATAKAGFNRKRKKANQEISMDNLDASKQSIPYIDQDEDGSDPSKEEIRNEQSITNRGGNSDSIYAENEREIRNEQSITNRGENSDSIYAENEREIRNEQSSMNAKNKRETFKSTKGLTTAETKFWQESLSSEDEIDGTTIIQKTHQCMRVISHNVSATLITKYVHLDKKKIKERRNNRENIRVADLTIQDDQEYFSDFVRMRSEMFVWLIFLAGIYYTLPVFQLVFNYQETSLTSGNLDTCYYNYLCQYPYGYIADYGHVLSNIGYIICGISFMGIVRFRSYKNKQLIDKFIEKELGLLHPKHTGIPESYGIFYALGAALMFEGILSGCYHVCPTETNFQFDTTFMYCISVLVFLKVYQFRHHDVTSTAHLVFLAIGVALIFEVVGIFTNHIIFWLLFIAFYISFVSVFVIQIYYNWSGDLTSRLRTIYKKVTAVRSCNGCTGLARGLLSIHPSKMVGSILVLAVNILLAVFFLTQTFKTRGVSRYILTILMVNMFLYVSHYISCKLRYRLRVKDWKPTEGIRKVTLAYGALSVLFMLAAGYFFHAELKSSKKSPAESRNLNAPCAIMIFDNHDIWHFLSAGGLFYLFMFILTLEDYNRDQQRDQIPVF